MVRLVEIRFPVDDLPIVVDGPVAGSRLVLLSGRSAGTVWRLSWAAVDLPGHGRLAAKLTDGRGQQCEVETFEESRDDSGEASGWWDFSPFPQTDGRITLAVWLAEPPWPRMESLS